MTGFAANPVENILNHLSFWTISGSLEKIKRTPQDPEASRNCYIAVQYSKLLCARSCYQSYPIVIYLLISSHNFFCITPFSKTPCLHKKHHQTIKNHRITHQLTSTIFGQNTKYDKNQLSGLIYSSRAVKWRLPPLLMSS